MRNEGGGFAANIYEAMPESRIQVTSYQSLCAPNPPLPVTSHSSLLSNFGNQDCGGGFAAIYDAMPESLRIAVLSYRHPERSDTTYLRQPLPERVRTESKDLCVPRFLTKEVQQVL